MASSTADSSKLCAAEEFLRGFASSTEERDRPLIGWKEDAIAYFASRGQTCDDWIKSLEQDWRTAADEAMEIYGQAYNSESVLLREAPLDRYVFFWEDKWHAPILRAAQWGTVSGFELWFKRLGEYLTCGALSEEDLFDTLRSDVALAQMRGLLRQVCYSAIRESSQIPSDIGLASSIVFSATRLKLDEDLSSIIDRLMAGQREDGGWPWYTHDRSPSVIATAQAVHALALAKPSGWQRAVAQASDFLWHNQQADGSWISDAARAHFPWLNVYDTVLVLDAIELASGGKRVSFSVECRINAPKDATSDKSDCCSSSGGEERSDVSADAGRPGECEIAVSEAYARVTVDPEAFIVVIDGKQHALNGGHHVKKRVAEFLQELIDVDGEYIPRPRNLKTRVIDSQPEPVRDLIDAQPGAGTRIPRDKLWRS